MIDDAQRFPKWVTKLYCVYVYILWLLDTLEPNLHVKEKQEKEEEE